MLVLGALAVRVDDVVIPVAGTRRRCILALLASRVGHAVSVEVLIGHLLLNDDAYEQFGNLVKLNPLAAFTDDDMALYLQLHELPAHPLADKGYSSIGCWPCTRPVAPGEDKRAGRWSGNAKTECGLHV